MSINEIGIEPFDKNAFIFASSSEVLQMPESKIQQYEHPNLDYSIIKEEDEVMYETNKDESSLNLSKEFSKISENRLQPQNLMSINQ